MTLSFPSPEFDHVVAAVCHGTATELETFALNELLRSNQTAVDEYLMRVEVHSRLGSEPDLYPQRAEGSFSPAMPKTSSRGSHDLLPPNSVGPRFGRTPVRALVLAACLALIATGIGSLWFRRTATGHGATPTAVARLARVVDAHWGRSAEPLRAGSALEPGRLRLESGLAQVVFSSGAPVVIEGPTELQLISPTEAFCPAGRLLAEVPEPARGFRLKTPGDQRD